MPNRLSEFIGSKWKGEGELWVDPSGNRAEHYECELVAEHSHLSYFWMKDGHKVHGTLSFEGDGVDWVDGWHQKERVQCSYVPDSWGIFTVQYEYEAPGQEKWRWRIKLSERPDSKLVLQMTNVAPWGEEGLAVRMVFRRKHA